MYAIFDKLCKEKGVSAYKVSKATGISTATLSDWKTGKSHPKADKIQKIADYFGVSTQYLTSGVEKSQHLEHYTDPETAKIAQEIFDDSYLHALFRAARGSKPEDVQMVTEMLNRFKGTNPDG